ncbi:LysR family transcriptional regulator [uncultured Maricaulis sp.]|uniref:LysR family transcriptional regulator n=1 Tax=uncultured Maricaulis sp. TaxID=174710 RepID=UPI00261D6D7B|nr:LysR family transcriptional regulator [uncultured Maricaulis sp.]
MSLAPGFSIAALRAFVGIVEAGSVTRAARTLHLSQSAVSHHLKAIEDRAGRALFTRTGQSLTLTEEGEIFYVDVRDALALLTGAVRRFSPQDGTRLVLGIQYSFGYHWLAPLLARLQGAFPDIDFELTLLADIPDARQRTIDLVISAWDVPGDVRTLATFDTQWRPYAQTGLVRSTDWAAGPWALITFENRTDWRSWGLSLDAVQAPWLRTDAAGIALELVKQGLGIGLCADIMARPARAAGLIEPISQQTAPLSWGQLNLHGSNRSPHRQSIDAVAAWLAETIRHPID